MPEPQYNLFIRSRNWQLDHRTDQTTVCLIWIVTFKHRPRTLRPCETRAGTGKWLTDLPDSLIDRPTRVIHLEGFFQYDAAIRAPYREHEDIRNRLIPCPGNNVQVVIGRHIDVWTKFDESRTVAIVGKGRE